MGTTIRLVQHDKVASYYRLEILLGKTIYSNTEFGTKSKSKNNHTDQRKQRKWKKKTNLTDK